MNAFQKLLGSSTAWLGAIVTGVTTWAQASGVGVPTWLAAAIVGAYGLKEAGSKVADAMATRYVVDAQRREDKIGGL